MSEDYARIFLLSHMRAFTSLAGHILGSHPRINGYFEMHLSYEDAAALDKQLEILSAHESLKENSHYLFDKLLHNDYQLNPERLGDTAITLLVALQEPEQTVKSIVGLFAGKGQEELYALPEGAVDYYVERLQWLAGFCRSVDRPYYYYDAELFQTAPERLLDGLTAWLALDTPLSKRYQLFSQTGTVRKGDSSDLIRSGKIEKTRTDYSHIDIPDDVLRRAHEVYRDCRSEIIADAADSMVPHMYAGNL